MNDLLAECAPPIRYQNVLTPLRLKVYVLNSGFRNLIGEFHSVVYGKNQAHSIREGNKPTPIRYKGSDQSRTCSIKNELGPTVLRYCCLRDCTIRNQNGLTRL